jgi:MCP family monocarboxylic acid transporter-like MFS transporter 10
LVLLSGLLCLVLWLLSNSLAVLVLFACLYGFSTASVTSLPAAVVGQITSGGCLGARIGAFYSVIAVASLVGTPIGGALITNADQKEGYRFLILFSVSEVWRDGLMGFADHDAGYFAYCWVVVDAWESVAA